MSDEKDELKFNDETEKTVIKALSLGGGAVGGCPVAVDVEDGRVVRIRPLHYDWKYAKEGK